MLFSIMFMMLMFCVSFTWGNECSNTSHTALVDTCLFSNITLNCTVSSAVNGSLDVEWRLYPDNRSINVSSMMFNNDTSSISFSVSQENVFFLVVQSDDPTNCPVCNISLDISQSTSAIVDAIQSYYKLEVNHSITGITADNVSSLVTTDQLSISNPNTLHTVGQCVTTIRYTNCVLQSESFAWYLNGSKINNSNFTLDESGRLTFTNARDSHAGLYLCVITLPGDLGSYITAATELKLSPTDTQGRPVGSNDDSTPTWAIVLIVAVSVIILGLLIVIGIFIQMKVGFWCCYTHFAIRRQVLRSQTQTSMASKAEFLKHQSSKDYLLREPIQKPKVLRMSSNKSATSSSKRTSLIRDKWECEYSCILFEELLCQGTFKKIHRAVIGTHSVIVKTLKNKESELGLDELMHETAIQKHIAKISNYFEHPNVLGLYGACTMDPATPYCLILEHMEHGTLDKLLLSLRTGPLPDWYISYLKQCVIPQQTYTGFVAMDLMEIIQQTVSAMIFLNRHGILHRDLSTRNIFIGDNLLVKVGNFGMTHEGRYYVVTERGHYLQDMAPECMNENKFSVKSDVWSFGVLLFKICSLETNPYPDVDPKDLYKTLRSGKRAKMPSTCSEELYVLMKRCWKLPPTERPTFTALQKYIGDHKYVPSNSIFFKLKGAQDQSDCTVDTEGTYLYQPPPEVAKLFTQLQGNNPWDGNAESHDRWSDDELYNTMRTVDTELPSEQSSAESHREETLENVKMRNEHKPRDRRQKRSLVYPTTAPNVAFSDRVFTNPHSQQQQLQRKTSDKTDGPGREKYTPSSNSASKLFKSDPLNMYLEPAYKELLIPSGSESSLDNDDIINTNTMPNNHTQGGFSYAYP